MKEAGYKWNLETLELEKMKEIKLKPFDKVLVRDLDTEEWRASFFSHYNPNLLWKFRCLGSLGYKYCIPYEGNEHLLGTNKDR